MERFTDGFKSLSQRLGFDVLNGNKYLSIVDDSNPSDFPIEGLSSKHSVVEAMRLIYKKLNIPTLFVTSGWSKASKYAQENAEKLVKEIKSIRFCGKSRNFSKPVFEYQGKTPVRL